MHPVVIDLCMHPNHETRDPLLLYILLLHKQVPCIRN
jgi:hypothetical protein